MLPFSQSMRHSKIISGNGFGLEAGIMEDKNDRSIHDYCKTVVSIEGA